MAVWKPIPFDLLWFKQCYIWVEIEEGKDTQSEQPAKQFGNFGKSVGVLLRLTKPPWGTANTELLNSSYCIVRGIVELKKRRGYPAALI
jgi:hypothetical protein